MNHNNLYGSDSAEPTDVTEFQEFREQPFEPPAASSMTGATINGEQMAAAAAPSANIPASDNTAKPKFRPSKKMVMIGGIALAVLIAAGASTMTSAPKKPRLPQLPVAVETMPIPAENGMLGAGTNGMDNQGLMSGPAAGVATGGLPPGADPMQAPVAGVQASNPAAPASTAPVTAVPAVDPAVQAAKEAADQRQAFERAQEKVNAENLAQKSAAAKAESAANAELQSKVASLEAKIAQLESSKESERSKRSAAMADNKNEGSAEKAEKPVKRRAAAKPLDEEAAIMAREARAERAQRNAERRAEKLAQTRKGKAGTKTEAESAPAAAATVPGPETIRLLGAGKRDGNTVVILESNGVKYQKAINEMLPGVGVISTIVIQNGAPVIEINGVTYR